MTRWRLPPTSYRARWTTFAALAALALAACGSSGSAGGDDDGDGPDDAAATAATPADAPAIAESEGLESSAGDLPTGEFTMSDGTVATFASFLDGKPLVINYFASWCAPCRAEMPDFAAVHNDVGDEVTFLGMDIQDTRPAAEELVEATGVLYEWGEDPVGEFYIELGGFSMPTTWYVAADGTIVDQDNGQIDEGVLRSRLRDLFGVDA